MAPQTGWLQERSRILPRSSLGSLQSLVCIPGSSPELMSGLWDSSNVTQIVIRQVRLIILISHELLQRKHHSKQVSALTYEPCTVSRSHPWRTESGQDLGMCTRLPWSPSTWVQTSHRERASTKWGSKSFNFKAQEWLKDSVSSLSHDHSLFLYKETKQSQLFILFYRQCHGS